MGANYRCLACDAHWYASGLPNGDCPDCGSGEIDLYVPPSGPDARMLEMVTLVEREGKISDADERLHEFFGDRGGGFDTYNLCIQLGLVRETTDDLLECGAVEAVRRDDP